MAATFGGALGAGAHTPNFVPYFRLPMTIAQLAPLAALVLLASSAQAQAYNQVPGVYRTAEAYRRRQPQPAGSDAFFPDKRGMVVAVVPRGPQTVKLRIAPDSVWGYVSGKGRAYRLYRGQEYQLDQADTLCVYSSISSATSGPQAGTSSGRQYYFSRGLTGLVFPLTVHYLREAYTASNPGFVTALGQLRFGESLSDFDKKTGLFRVTTLYRKEQGR